MDTAKKELFISYKREPVSERLAGDLKTMIETSFPFLQVIMDTKGVRTGSSIKAYMDRLTQGNYIIFLLSPAFLESHWCMYELALTADYPDFKERIFHVRLPGVGLSTPNEVSKIVRTWKNRYADLKADMEDIAEIEPSHLAPGFADHLQIMGTIVRAGATALFHLFDTLGLEANDDGEINWTEMLAYLKDWIQAPAPEPPSPAWPTPIIALLADMLPIPGADTQPAFHMGRHPITQAQWQAVMGGNPSHFQRADAPVECVSWADCQDFLARLNALTGRAFRLPKEAEWEYAASAGMPVLEPVSAIVHDQNAHWQSQPIGGRPANAFGLQDMLGNVFEWCADLDSEDLTGKADLRVIRGGAWLSHADDCTAFARHNEYADTRHPAIGFRLAEGG